MPIPTHGPFCVSWMYETICWHCDDQISVLQCSCGSAVLLDEGQPPWPKHYCGNYIGSSSGESYSTAGIGVSGLTGWAAIDQLRSAGMPITPTIVKWVFGEENATPCNKPTNPDIESVPPKLRTTADLIVNLIDFHKATSNTLKANSFTSLAKQIEGFPSFNGPFAQVTLHHVNGNKRYSYTALIDVSLVPSSVQKHKAAHSIFQASLIGTNSYWVVLELHLL